LEIPQKARDSHFSHSFNNNKLDDRDHFQQNAKTSVASLRPLIGSSRNSDRHQNGTLIDFIGIPTVLRNERFRQPYLPLHKNKFIMVIGRLCGHDNPK